MKLFMSAGIMLLAASSSPFESCGNSWQKKIDQDQAKQAPPPRMCATDPPNGCGVLCPTKNFAEGLGPAPPSNVWTTDFCSEPSAGVLTDLFITDAQTILVCDTEAMGGSYIVFPTYFLITPNVVETGNGCVPPPPPPTVLMVKDILGGGAGDE